jgi:subtilisin family serine protease/subtilisin-like proprotein convertase family protein
MGDMAETTYFWQGGRRIAIHKDERAITLHADSEADAQNAAARAGVHLHALHQATPSLMRASVVGDRDGAVNRLRAQGRVVHHVYRNAQHGEQLVTESFFIKFKAQTPEPRIREFMRSEGLIVERDMGPQAYLVRVTHATGRNPLRTANEAAEREDVDYAEPNLVRPLARFATIPADGLFASQWHLHAPRAAADLEAGAGIFAPDAWDITRGRRDVVVAVADDGFDLTHPDFQGEGKVAGRLNAVLRGAGNNAAIDWDADVSPRPGDYHGTPCLGIAVAEGSGTGVVGVAPGCALLAVRFPLHAMTDAHFIVMFEKISLLADVVSCSWGVGPADMPMSTPLKAAMAALARTGGRRGKGLVFCIAAGNSNCPVQDLDNRLPYQYRTDAGMRVHQGPIDRWIAAHPDAITVSASTSRKTRSACSSWGKEISVCAPSDNWDDLGETSPRGLGIVTTDNASAGARPDGADGGFGAPAGSRYTHAFGGTSSATPAVAGVCALVLSANPSLAADQVGRLVRQTADKDLSLVTDTPVDSPGQFNDAGVSPWFGHGKVNAFKAVRAAAAGVQEERSLDISQNTALDIPDQIGVPVFTRIDIPHEGFLTDLRVQVNITHTYIGDLRVDLLAPNGTSVPLHGNSGGSAANLNRTYSLQNTPALRALLEGPVRGTWQLRVSDSFRQDAGRIDRWRIVARVARA